MQLLKERILKDGTVKPGNILKVDSFLNHQMDIPFINEIGKEYPDVELAHMYNADLPTPLSQKF